MGKKMYVFLKFCSLTLLCSLFFNAFIKLDIASTKNDHLIGLKKVEIDSAKNINEVKQQAKAYLTTIRETHKKVSSDAIINLVLIISLLMIEIFLWFKSSKRSSVIVQK